jgi:hypothetical protein
MKKNNPRHTDASQIILLRLDNTDSSRTTDMSEKLYPTLQAFGYSFQRHINMKFRSTSRYSQGLKVACSEKCQS